MSLSGRSVEPLCTVHTTLLPDGPDGRRCLVCRSDSSLTHHLIGREAGEECWECSVAVWLQLPALPGHDAGGRPGGGLHVETPHLPPSPRDQPYHGPALSEQGLGHSMHISLSLTLTLSHSLSLSLSTVVSWQALSSEETGRGGD